MISKEPTTIPSTSIDVSAISTSPAIMTNVNITSTSPTILITNATTTINAMQSTSELHTTLSTTPSITTTTTTTTTTVPTTTTTTIQVTTEGIEYGQANFSPRRDKILKKIPVTAGKPLSYVIPANTFYDFEDGDTRKLKLSLYWQGVSLKPTHWLQFNQHAQEVYGL